MSDDVEKKDDLEDFEAGTHPYLSNVGKEGWILAAGVRYEAGVLKQYDYREKLYIHYEVVDDSGEKQTVFIAFNRHKKYGPKSKYYRYWTALNGKPPKKGQRMVPNNFINRIVAAKLKTNTMKLGDKEITYSVIEDIDCGQILVDLLLKEESRKQAQQLKEKDDQKPWYYDPDEELPF